MAKRMGSCFNGQSCFAHVFFNNSLNRAGSQAHFFSVWTCFQIRLLATSHSDKHRVKRIVPLFKIPAKPQFCTVGKKNHPGPTAFTDNPKFSSFQINLVAVKLTKLGNPKPG